MAHEGPLVVLEDGSPRELRVCDRLEHPVWAHDGDAAEEGRRLLTALQLLEGVCRRMVVLSGPGIEPNESAMDALRERAAALHAEAEAAFEGIYSRDATMGEYMDRTRLAAQFPKTRALIADPPRPLPRARAPVDTYFQHFGMLHQLVSLSRQIRHDLHHLGTHKYVAHQLAMLYQSLTNAGEPVAAIRKRVEARFNEVKQATAPARDDDAPVRLPVHLARWLEGVLDEVVAAVEALPRIYRDPLVRPTRFMMLQERES